MSAPTKPAIREVEQTQPVDVETRKPRRPVSEWSVGVALAMPPLGVGAGFALDAAISAGSVFPVVVALLALILALPAVAALIALLGVGD